MSYSLPVFSRSQYTQAQGLTRIAAESVVASALDIPVSRLRQWRLDGVGPDYETTVNGQTVYRRQVVLAFMRNRLR
ncbi:MULTISPECIES: hypothetical protein [unclassified Bifidobacterium]|uniref:hypothetical protein n=1 Tax=unclassified Bifidobacterium TaxID=2608897 RepID=UPI00112DF826|nr:MULTISPECIES: hypothetical protein [unclassified Bifidobacterium]TPF79342.1 hypothetical protein BW08_10590 [Bifidobacterium sp. UTCIF-24]TPF84353.1 hypothetical protein BW07_05145 [Bifidobacterium sp. UTCIF-36]TPF91030.1 hypothetical protein BW10_02090 [Bifidobacterium sp. UTBIF-56]